MGVSVGKYSLFFYIWASISGRSWSGQEHLQYHHTPLGCRYSDRKEMYCETSLQHTVCGIIPLNDMNGGIIPVDICYDPFLWKGRS